MGGAIYFGSTRKMELWGIFHCLSIAWEKEFKKVVMECDSSQAVQLLNDGQAASDNLALVRKYSRTVRTWLGYLHCPSPTDCESSGWQNRGLAWVSSCKFLFPLLRVLGICFVRMF
ncbi:hypothetical protein PVK06_021521 [Gossypium arboreum]|uniref:RNase H type-1 domain-containing protein n=1 Tax=Gossypium arboreum TaxID=29729 RepID=A0ABR0PQ80_GOSAR|nr:hypothetical protein PVK06_021521 [Gossypium arboreum]